MCNLALIALVLFAISLSSSCSKSDGNDNPENDTLKKMSPEDSIRLERLKPPPDTIPLIRYKLDTIKNKKHLSAILSRFKSGDKSHINHKIFITLNRKEMRFVGVGQAVVIPDTVIPNVRAYSCFPQFYPGGVDLKKLILISNKYQSYACYEYGRLVRFAACNTGKEATPSFPGRYALAWKERVHRSSLDSSWEMPFTFNFHTEAGSAFHQFVMPGKPASHSCIRQFLDDAEWLFKWGSGIKKDSNNKLIPLSGTPVVIIDHYDFNPGKGGSWKYLKSNKDTVFNLPAEPMKVEEALIPIIQIPEGARGSLRNKKRFIYAEDTLRARGVIREGIKLTPSVNFNKLKREKKAREAREAIKKQQQNKQPQGNNPNQQNQR